MAAGGAGGCDCDGPDPGASFQRLSSGLSLESDLTQLKRTVAIASLSTFCLGYNTGIVAGAQRGIQEDAEFMAAGGLASGELVSCALLGAALGAFCGQVANSVGRRATLLAVAGVFTVAPLAMAAAPDFSLLIVARSLCGLSIGVSSVLTNLYISEVSPAECRGRLGGWAPFIGTSGILASYIVSAAFQYFPDGAWRWQFGLGVIPALAQLLLRRNLPETPRWLLAQSRKEDARECLQLLFPQAAQTALDAEITKLEADLSHAADVAAVSCLGLCHKEYRAGTLVGVAINILQQVSGINVFIYFAPQILDDAGFGRYSMISTVLVSLIQLTATAVLIQYIDKVGRRPLALIGLIGMMGGLVLLSIGSVMRGAGLGVAVTAWFSLAGMLLFRAAFSLSLGPLPYVMTSEFFAQEARAAGVGFCWAMNWLANFAVSLSFPLLAEAAPGPYGQASIFCIYLFFCVVALVFVYLLLPETNGIRLEAVTQHADAEASCETTTECEAAPEVQRDETGTSPLHPRASRGYGAVA